MSHSETRFVWLMLIIPYTTSLQARQGTKASRYLLVYEELKTVRIGWHVGCKLQKTGQYSGTILAAWKQRYLDWHVSCKTEYPPIF